MVVVVAAAAAAAAFVLCLPSSSMDVLSIVSTT
jgi:hypothetical protein